VRQALLELAIGMRLGKAGPLTSSPALKQHRVAGDDRLTADGDRQMRVLPTPGGPSSRTASLLMMNRLPAISRTCAVVFRANRVLQ
jgi:hypothetical protein